MAFTERERKFVFRGGLGALLILAYTLVISPLLRSNKSNVDEIERKLRLIERFTSLIQHKKSVQNEYETLDSDLSEVKKGLLAPGPPSIAAADLQRFLNETAKTSNITIESEKVLDAFEESIFMVVPVEIVIKSNLRNVSRFLFAIENGRKFITVQYLKMRNSRKLSRHDEELIESRIIARGYYIRKQPPLTSEKTREPVKI